MGQFRVARNLVHDKSRGWIFVGMKGEEIGSEHGMSLVNGLKVMGMEIGEIMDLQDQLLVVGMIDRDMSGGGEVGGEYE